MKIKRILFSFLLLLFFNILNTNCQNEYEYYWSGGEIKYRKINIDTNKLKKTESVKTYWKNGQIKIDCNYTNSKLDGKYIKYYPDGQIEIKCNYVNGNLDGKYLRYNHDGKIDIDCNYTNGKLNGKYIEYYHDGEIRNTGNYVNGIKEGYWKETHYIDKGGEYEGEYFSGGVIEHNGHYVNGKKNGQWEFRHSISYSYPISFVTTKSKVKYINDKKEGYEYIEEIYRSGLKSYKREYKIYYEDGCEIDRYY